MTTIAAVYHGTENQPRHTLNKVDRRYTIKEGLNKSWTQTEYHVNNHLVAVICADKIVVHFSRFGKLFAKGKRQFKNEQEVEKRFFEFVDGKGISIFS